MFVDNAKLLKVLRRQEDYCKELHKDLDEIKFVLGVSSEILNLIPKISNNGDGKSKSRPRLDYEMDEDMIMQSNRENN